MRSLTTNAARTSTASLLALAASILAPTAIPASTGPGRLGNAAARFAAACGLPWHSVRVERLGKLRAELVRRGLGLNTINRTLSSVRGVLNQCWKEGSLDLEALDRAKLSLVNVKGETVSRGRHLTKSELAKLMAACEADSSPAGARDALLLALLAAGLRRSEVASIQLEHLNDAHDELTVHGKGHKQRIVFVAGGGKNALDAWLQLRGLHEGPLLHPIDKSGHIAFGLGISSQAIYKALQKRAAQAKVEVSPHDLRRTLIGEAFTAGVDVSTIQKIVGHSSPSTTSRYDRRDDILKKSVMKLLAVQYRVGEK